MSLLRSPRGVFVAATAILYASFILLGVLALNPYFAQTWDVTTFVHAAHRLIDGGNPLDLYAQTRAAQTWPYAYPPLHAFAVALALLGGQVAHLFPLLPALPEYVWARLPATAADIGVGAVLYAIVGRKSGDDSLARLALVLWLFNPVTFYDTAVQGHFESEWLLFILLAYAWFEEGRSPVLPALALAVAVLFKQNAVLFAIPLWMFVAVGAKHSDNLAKVVNPSQGYPNASPLQERLRRLAVSGFVFAVVVGAVCLPFLLYSNDFWYMNLTYLENVPVQTQSWIVALLGVTRTAPDALTSDFFLLRYQMPVMLLAAIVAGALAVWRGKGLYWAAALIAILFFLTSRKVMGYYYVMLLPFLLVECLPTRRLTLVLAAVVATAWISLSPYYAAWGDPGHWWIYAALGTANSLFFVWLAVRLTLPETPMGAPAGDRVDTDRAREPVRDATVLVSVGLFAAAVFASFLQPLVQSSGSAIRAPLIAPGMEGTAATAFVALAGMILIALALATRATQAWGKRAGWAAWGAVLIFAPLFFAVYTLTKESTAVFEIALKALGG